MIAGVRHALGVRRAGRGARALASVLVLALAVSGCESGRQNGDDRGDAGFDTALDEMDVASKAQLVIASAQTLRKIHDSRGLLGSSAESRRKARSIARDVSRLLLSDTRGVVTMLVTDDPIGISIKTWLRQTLESGEIEDVHKVLRELWSGPSGEPAEHLADSETATNLGYVVGALVVGLREHQRDPGAELALAKELLAAGPGERTAPGKVLSLASEERIDEILGRVDRRQMRASEAVYVLMLEGLPATTESAIDTAMSRVIRWHEPEN